MKKLINILLALMLAKATFPQTNLNPGDIALIAVNSDGEKSFTVLFLKSLEAGTEIHFTDNAWVTPEWAFRETEGVLTYTAPSDLPAGTVVTCPGKDGGNGFVESGSFNPAGSGDNIIVFQGSLEDPFFLFGVGWARGASVWEFSEVSSSYRSDIPPGLSLEDGTCVSLGTDDGYVLSANQLLSYSLSRGQFFSWITESTHFESSNADELVWSGEVFSVLEDITSAVGADAGSDPILWTELSWNNGVPHRFSKVEVSGLIAVNQADTVHDLTILAGSQVEILPGGSLTVLGDLINSAGSSGLIIRSDASGSGALYSSSEGVDGLVEIYLSPDQWHFVSAPVEGAQTVSDVFGHVGEHLLGVYRYDEPVGGWSVVGSGLLEVGVGYDVYYQGSAKNLKFEGTLNSFRFRKFFSITRGAGEGWNLIGNPFPAPLAWNQGMRLENLEHGTIYITTGGAGSSTSWDTFNGVSGIGVPDNEVGNVAVGQGFWVRAGGGGGMVGVSGYGRTRGEHSFKYGGAPEGPDFRTTPINRGVLRPGDSWKSEYHGDAVRLVLESEFGGNDQVAVVYDRNASVGYDLFDSEKFEFGKAMEGLGEFPQCASGRSLGSSVESSLALAVSVSDRYCVIASYPDDNQEIPLALHVPLVGTYRFRIEKSNKFLHSSFILEDRLLGITHDFSKEEVYEFHAGGGFLSSRFVLKRIEKDVDSEVFWEEGIQMDKMDKMVQMDRGEDLFLDHYFVDFFGRRFEEFEDIQPGYYLEVCVFDSGHITRKIFFDGIW